MSVSSARTVCTMRSTRRRSDATHDVVVRPIHSETDHRAVLAEIETTMRAEPGTPEGDRQDVYDSACGGVGGAACANQGA